jgi:hypothetical protein
MLWRPWLAFLGAGQGLELRDPDVHLLRRLGVGGVEELERQSAQVASLAGGRDPVGGWDVGHLDVPVPGSRDAAGDELARVVREHRGEGVAGPPRHGAADDDVLADGELVERLDRAGGNDRHATGPDVGLVDDALDAAIMVEVGVGVDHPRHRLLVDMLVEQSERLPRRGDRVARVDDDQPLGAVDDGDVATGGAADLV